MISRRVLFALIASATISLDPLPRSAHATTVVPVTIETLARRADEVLIVTPRHATSAWFGRVIDTDYDLEVQTVVRGASVAGAHVTLRAPGGVVGSIGQQIPGVPALEINRPYVVFLSRASDVPGVFYLTHLTAAVLPVTAASDGTLTALPAAEGMRVRTGIVVPNALATEATAMAREGMTLDALVREIRSAH